VHGIISTAELKGRSLLLNCPTRTLLPHQLFGLSLSMKLPFCLLPLTRALTESPDSRVVNFHTCHRSLTPPQPTILRRFGMVGIAFFPSQRAPIPLLTIEA